MERFSCAMKMMWFTDCKLPVGGGGGGGGGGVGGGVVVPPPEFSLLELLEPAQPDCKTASTTVIITAVNTRATLFIARIRVTPAKAAAKQVFGMAKQQPMLAQAELSGR